MKKYFFVFLLWFCFKAGNGNTVAAFLNRLPEGTQYQITATQFGQAPEYCVFYKAEKEIKF